jgi:TRAP-type C4-dicarboxylate transport system substrate-binding protein
VIVSQRIWDRLSPQQQLWLEQAMADATVFQRDLWEDSTNDSLKQMVEEGVQILEPDLEAFRSSVSSVIERHATGDLRPMYERMRAAKP